MKDDKRFTRHDRRHLTGAGGSLRMPNLRGKAVHNELFPVVTADGRTMLRRDPVAANINRAQRQVAKSQRTPWRRPKPVR